MTHTLLPTFLELARAKLEYAGPREKTITVKVAINTARMMVERESATCNSHAELLEACKAVVGDYLHLAQDADGKVDSIRLKRHLKLQAAIARAERIEP